MFYLNEFYNKNNDLKYGNAKKNSYFYFDQNLYKLI